MATAMAPTAVERAVLEASLRFTLPGSGMEGPARQENFILGSSGTDQVKGVLTLQGDALSQADVNLKMPRNNQLLHFAFREDKQWKLQQIQDARNHVSQAIYLLNNRDESYQFRTGAEVLKLMDAVMLQLTRARNRLTTPATLTLPEIAASGLTRMFTPALPSDLLVNVYINLNKLCLTVYQLHTLQPNSTKNFRPAGGSVLHSPGAMLSRCSPATGATGLSKQSTQEPVPLRSGPYPGCPRPYHTHPGVWPKPSATGDLLPSLPVLPVTFAQMGVEHWNFWNEGKLTCFLFWVGVGQEGGVRS
ncbi:protein rogdi homolog isoform X2 [Myotis lucifugus]|uniref:protein rogdi homolog isoform X2 n=1 Tax=Myotis lucifugus TaxID=59463 RepID=UPI000CCC95A9|nr:protein rogdi homolog isoform X2 [Myotis lucifugus]